MGQVNHRTPKINCSKEELYDLFVVQNKSYNELAKIFNCSKDNVKITLRKLGIRKIDNSGNSAGDSAIQPPTSAPVDTVSVIAESGDKIEDLNSNTVPTVSDKDLFKALMAEAKGDVKTALFNYCFERNIFFDDIVVNGIVKKCDDHLIESLPDYYNEIIRQTPKYNGLTFRSQLKIDNFSKIYSEELNLLALSEDDKKNRQQIMTILGYDPFKDDSDDERPQLYRDLTGLITEDLRKDIAKQKAAVEIVRNYNTISRYQKKVSRLMKSGKTDADTQEEIDSLLQMISKIQAIVNATTKENGFTAGKTVGSGGRGMLSDVMNQVELGYDEGITNYYDQATSKSIGEVADISFKSMLAQVRLTGTDYAEIIEQQAKMVKDCQVMARKAQEACRLAKEKVTKQKLLDELAADYKRKNISEEEIKEFVDREYKLYTPGESK